MSFDLYELQRFLALLSVYSRMKQRLICTKFNRAIRSRVDLVDRVEDDTAIEMERMIEVVMVVQGRSSADEIPYRT